MSRKVGDDMPKAKYMIEADTHCHTVASTHAYGTIGENAAVAKEKGLLMIAMTDHGPSLPDGAHSWHFYNSRVLPRKIFGVTILRGIEANIMNTEGELDLEDVYFRDLDWVIASFHKQTFIRAGINEHTEALLNTLDNDLVDVIGHPDAPVYPFDVETVIKACKAKNKLIEINNSSFTVRKGGDVMRSDIIKACMKYEVQVVVNSDAHCPWDVGNVSRSLTLLEEHGFPPELIFNAKAQNIAEYIKAKHGRDIT